MPYGQIVADSITTSDGYTVGGSGAHHLKNRIINGAMTIDQRSNGASVTATTGNYTLDRWQAYATQSSKFTIQQNAGSVTPPAGFTKYLGITSSSAYSSISTDFFSIYQWIEGNNIADLSWGTSNAKTVTLSFWVYSSLTGTFGGTFLNAAQNRSYPFNYTISAANTWEQKTVTVVGDTSGSWGTTNGQGIGVLFDLGSGSNYRGTVNTWASATYYVPTGATSVVGTNAATFYITGVQLEAGSTATSYDYRHYSVELQMCQRYFYQWSAASASSAIAGSGQAFGSTSAYILMKTPMTMRVPPVTFSSAGTFGSNNTSGGGVGVTSVSLVSTWTNENMITLQIAASSGWTAGQACLMNGGADASCRLNFSAEL